MRRPGLTMFAVLLAVPLAGSPAKAQAVPMDAAAPRPTACSGAPSPGLFRACVNARPGTIGSPMRSMGSGKPVPKSALQGPGIGVTPRQLRAQLK